MILLVLILILLLLIIFLKNSYLEHFKNVSIDEYHKIMLNNNNNSKLYNIGLNNNLPINREDCYEKCDKANCLKMFEMNRILKKCLTCNSQKNKCFRKSIIGGTCDDCNEKTNCYDIQNFGCANPKNLNDNIGVEPYFTEINDNNINSPYDKKCVFCWNILDNI